MVKDVTAFRERFNAYKNGKSVSEIYDAGLPRYDVGKIPETVDDATLDFIINHEGFKPNTWVKDPVTGKMLLGSGIDIDKYKELFRKTGKWSAEDNRNAVRDIVIANRSGIRKTFGKAYDNLTSAQKGVLDDIAYNIGVGKLNSKFSPKFVAAVLSGDMEEAKRQMDWGNHQARGLFNRNKDRQAWWDTVSSIRPPKYIARPDNYDYETAEALGYQPDETGHWPSRNYVTGEYLKSPSHPTMMKTIVTDIGQGYNTFYNKNTGRIGSQTWMKPLPRPTFDIDSGEIKIPFLYSDDAYSYKNGKLPGYKDGTPTKIGEYNVYPSAVGASELNVTVPEVTVTGIDRRPMYQRYDAENSTYDPEAIRTFTDFAPIVSDIGDGLDAYNAFKNRDWSLFGIIAGTALLPNVIEKALQPVLRFVLPIAKRYVSPLVDKYISPTIDRLFSNTKQLSLPSSETSLRVIADDFNFDFSPSLEDGRATAVRNATELSILDAFDSRLPYAKNTNSPLVRAVPATMENNKKLVDHYLLLIKEAYPGVSDEEAKKLFEQIHEASVDDVLYARGMTVRDPVTHEVKFVSYNNQGNKTRSAATKTHEENHTMYDLSPDRFLHPTVTALDSPLGIKKNYLNEEAGYSLPKNINDPNDYDGIEEYLSADEVSSFMSEAKSLLGKTGDEKLTEGDIEWFIKNHNLIGNKLLLHGIYKSIAEHITNAKKFALWCNDYSNVVAALAIGGAASTAAALLEYANGKFPGYKNGKIYIKPANRGKFTALKKRTGHSASWFKENGTPAQKKMAVFALNSKKWKH